MFASYSTPFDPSAPPRSLPIQNLCPGGTGETPPQQCARRGEEREGLHAAVWCLTSLMSLPGNVWPCVTSFNIVMSEVLASGKWWPQMPLNIPQLYRLYICGNEMPNPKCPQSSCSETVAQMSWSKNSFLRGC